MKWDLFNTCDQLVWGTFNGVWQGMLISLAVALGLRFLGRTNAATRHAVWFATLLVLAALVPANIVRSLVPGPSSGMNPPQQLAQAGDAAHNQQEQTVAAQMPASAGPESGPSAAESMSESPSPAPHPFSNPRPDDASVFIPALEPTANNLAEMAPKDPSDLPAPPNPVPAALGQAHPDSTVERVGAGSLSWRINRPGGIPHAAGCILIGLWCLVAGARLSALLLNLARMRRLKHSAASPSESLSSLFATLQPPAGYRQAQLKISKLELRPILLGFLHPVILLPAAQEQRPESETTHILRHELAHVRRRDDWANLAQHLLQSIFFFHPALAWVNARASLEREIACDDWALQSGSSCRAYAALLADFAGRLQQARPLPAPGVFNTKHQLQQRINMILNTRRNTSPVLAKTRLGFITTLAALGGGLALWSGPKLVLAEQPPQPANASGSLGSSPTAGSPTVALAPAAQNGSSDSISLAPAAGLATDDEPAPPQPPDVPPAPKIKPGSEDNALPSVPPVPAIAPHPPAAALFGSGGGSVVVLGHPPGPEAAPRPPGAGDDSIEARLDRLEKMVRSLMENRQGSTHSSMENRQGTGSTMWKFMPPNNNGGYGFAWSGPKPPPEIEKRRAEAAAQAERAEQRADRARDRAERDAQKALKDGAEGHGGTMNQGRDSLQKSMEDLKRQMEQLDRQIDKLQDAKDHLQKELELRRDLLNDSQNEKPADPFASGPQPRNEVF